MAFVADQLTVQWGTEIPTSLDSNGQKEVGLQMVWILNGI